MAQIIPKPLIDTLRSVVEMLVAGNFSGVEALSGGIRLSASEIRNAIREYGESLTKPPDTAYDDLDAIEVTGSDPRRWSVRFDLWTEQEGKSDLSLEVTIIDDGPQIEIDNLHIL